MNVIIFGTGKMYQRNKKFFENMEIVAFIDNDVKKWNTYIDNHMVMDPNQIINIEFDYVFLVSAYYSDMRKQLYAMNIPEKKIIDCEHRGMFQNLITTENYLFPDRNLMYGKRVLLFSHALDLTGAPVALCRLAHILKKNGYNVTVFTEKNCSIKCGELLFQLLEDKISVVFYGCLDSIQVEDIVEQYDIFWVNTITLFYIVKKLVPTGKKICWWLHEADDIYNDLDETIIYPCAKNLYTYSVGWLAQNAYEGNSHHKITKNLLYGIPNFDDDNINNHILGNTIRFGIIGAYCPRKGQDILYSAIEKHEEWRNCAEFVFIGRMPQDARSKYEQQPNIICEGELALDKVTQWYNDLDVVICPSLYDPMPIVVSEAMQHKKMCIVTDRVGQAFYIQNGIDGLICRAGSEDEIAEKIEWVINNKKQIRIIGERSYKIYEEHFSYKKFEENILYIMQELN